MTVRARGFALPLALVLLLALTALAHGALVLARRELQASLAFREAVRARWAARGAVDLVGDALPADWRERRQGEVLGPLESRWEEGVWVEAMVRWMSREFFLVEGAGGSGRWEGRERRGWVGWSLHPVDRLGARRGVAEVGGGVRMESGAGVTGGGLGGVPAHWSPRDCREAVSVADSLFPGGALPTVAPFNPPGLWPPEGSGETHEEDIPSLGVLSGRELLARSRGELGGGGGLGGRDGVGCPGVSGPLFRGNRESLRLAGGRYCGLLVVGGDLTLSGDAVFQGLALVGGTLRIEGDGRLEGMVRVRGDLLMGPRSRLQGRACPVFRALADIRELREPVFLPHAAGFWVF